MRWNGDIRRLNRRRPEMTTHHRRRLTMERCPDVRSIVVEIGVLQSSKQSWRSRSYLTFLSVLTFTFTPYFFVSLVLIPDRIGHSTRVGTSCRRMGLQLTYLSDKWVGLRRGQSKSDSHLLYPVSYPHDMLLWSFEPIRFYIVYLVIKEFYDKEPPFYSLWQPFIEYVTGSRTPK